MSDIVERLRNPMWAQSQQLEQEENLAAMLEAAHTITRLRSELDQARAEAYEDAAKICEQIQINAERRGTDHIPQSAAQNAAFDKAEAASDCKRAIRERIRSLAVASTERDDG